jgi:hypothetical protein
LKQMQHTLMALQIESLLQIMKEENYLSIHEESDEFLFYITLTQRPMSLPPCREKEKSAVLDVLVNCKE